MDHFFVARDVVGRKHHRVALHEAELAVGAGRQAPHDRGGLALRAGAHQHHLGRVHLQCRFEVDDEVVGHIQVAQVAGHLGVVAHAAADDRHLSPVALCRVGHLLNPRDQRSE